MKRVLLGAGVDESICNHDGKTALAVVKILRQWSRTRIRGPRGSEYIVQKEIGATTTSSRRAILVFEVMGLVV